MSYVVYSGNFCLMNCNSEVMDYTFTKVRNTVNGR